MEEDNKKSQRAVIRDFLQSGGTLTALEALRDFGCYRLGARISELRKEGMKIISTPERSVSRVTGKLVRFVRYRIGK